MKAALIFLLSITFSSLITAQEAPRQTFQEWLAELRSEASQQGISEQTLSALDAVEPLERVIELDNSQPEFVQTFTRYLSLRVTSNQVSRGQALLDEHAALLNEVKPPPSETIETVGFLLVPVLPEREKLQVPQPATGRWC